MTQERKISLNDLLEVMSQHHRGTILNEQSIKVVTEKYVDSPEDAARVVNNEPPVMTLSRAKRLIDQGTHVHGDKEYIHCFISCEGSEELHGLQHLTVDSDLLKDVMDNGEFDTGENTW